MSIMKEQTFEDTLWRGYLANRVVYEAAAGAAHTPAESEAIKKLELLFNRLDESVLHTWIESGLPIGPRIGVKGIPEPTLLAFAKWHLSLFARKREDERRLREEKRSNRDIWIKGIGVGVSVATAIFGILKALKIF